MTEPIDAIRLVGGVQGPPGVPTSHTGAWSSATAYLAGQAARHLGSTYVALVDNTNVTPVDGATWRLLAEKGADGSGAPPDASTTVKGLSLINPAPAGAASPTALGINSPLLPTQDENDALVGTSGAPSTTNKYVTNADARVPTQGENDALIGTSGTPSSTNPFVTTLDARVTDAILVAATAVAVPSATTLTTTAFGKHHHLDTATSYTVTLPTPVGNAGKTISFQGTGSTTTGTVTLATPAGNFRGYYTTLSMQHMDTLVLRSDGTNWHVLADGRRNFGAPTSYPDPWLEFAFAANTTYTSSDLRGANGIPTDARGYNVKAYSYNNTQGVVYLSRGDVEPATDNTFVFRQRYANGDVWYGSFAIPLPHPSGTNPGSIRMRCTHAILGGASIVGWWR
jgi:hypothetical protein